MSWLPGSTFDGTRVGVMAKSTRQAPFCGTSFSVIGRSTVEGGMLSVCAAVVPEIVTVETVPLKSFASLETFTASVPPVHCERIQLTWARDHASTPGVVG